MLFRGFGAVLLGDWNRWPLDLPDGSPRTPLQSAPMEIRPAEPRDADTIATIYNHEIVHSTATFDTEPVTAAERRTWLATHASERHPVLVAEIEGCVVGWAALSPWSDRCAYARAAEVSIYIDANARGAGVGRTLLTALVAKAREVGLGVLLARISSGEGPASSNLHQSLGFRSIGIMRRVGEKFGRILDVEIFENHLDE